jgi:hypothetical protein
MSNSRMPQRPKPRLQSSPPEHRCSHGNLVLPHRSVVIAPIHKPAAQGRWWRRTGLNRRPPACKAGALPLSYAPGCHARAADAPQLGRNLVSVVGPGRFELPTSRLSSARSNQLSYEPGSVDPPSTRPPQQGQTRAWLSFRIGKGCAGGGIGFDDPNRTSPAASSRGRSS